MGRGFVLTAALIGAHLAAVAAQQTPVHDLRLTPENVHWGYYDSNERLNSSATAGEMRSGARRLVPTITS